MDESAYIRLRDVHKRFLEAGKERPVLRGLFASFGRGEIAAIRGRSGSGKSTLLNVISGVDIADSGEIWLGGEDLVAMSERRRTLFRRANIGLVFQFFNLIPTLTVLENVVLPLELEAVAHSRALERGERILREVSLWDRRDAYPDRLSGGEQQRVAVARALVHDPILVLADEPTGNLDEKTGSQVLALLDRLTRERGRNLILATHSREVSHFADRVLELRRGVLVELDAAPGSGGSG
jgi:putative ABC transport system ATP-binding protein